MKTLYESIFDPNFEPTKDNTKLQWYETDRTEDTLSFAVDARDGAMEIEDVMDRILKRGKKLVGRARNDVPDRMKNNKEPFVIAHEKPNDTYYLLYGFADGSYRMVTMKCRFKNWFFPTLHCEYISTIGYVGLPGAYGTWENWRKFCLSRFDRYHNFYRISQKDFEAAYKFVLSKYQ